MSMYKVINHLRRRSPKWARVIEGAVQPPRISEGENEEEENLSDQDQEVEGNLTSYICPGDDVVDEIATDQEEEEQREEQGKEPEEDHGNVSPGAEEVLVDTSTPAPGGMYTPATNWDTPGPGETPNINGQYLWDKRDILAPNGEDQFAGLTPSIALTPRGHLLTIIETGKYVVMPCYNDNVQCKTHKLLTNC